MTVNLKLQVRNYCCLLNFPYYSKDFWRDIVSKQWPIYKDPIPLDKKDAHLCSTPAIFSGDFAAAYYCSLWSHMLAADIYQSFVESGKREAWKHHGLRSVLISHVEYCTI